MATVSKLGPHVLSPSAPALAWARRADVVKSVGNTAAIQAAPDHALRIYRWPFSETDQDRMLRDTDGAAVVGHILNGLAGYRHPRLHVELLNEVHRDRTAQYIALARAVVPQLHAIGVKVAVPSWSTGAYEQEHWDAWRQAGWAGADLIALHGYWGNQGFTLDHALRWRRYWQPRDPLVVVTECGRDRIEGGRGGWLADGVTDAQYLAELIAYDDELTRDPAVVGGTGFSCGCVGEWDRWRDFELDPLAPDLALLYTPWTPPAIQDARQVGGDPQHGVGGGHDASANQTPVTPSPAGGSVVAELRGIDISNNQGVVDLGKVKAAGYGFVAIKASGDEGGGDNVFIDRRFAANWWNAGVHGLARIAYHYARPSVKSPADSVTTLKTALDAVGGLRQGDNVALDLEDPDVPDGVSLHVWTAEWLALAERVFGVVPWRYSARYYTSTHDLEHDDLARYPVWWASYQKTKPQPAPGWGPIEIWQRSASGVVPGVQGDCDLDVFDGTLDELRALGLPLQPLEWTSTPVDQSGQQAGAGSPAPGVAPGASPPVAVSPAVPASVVASLDWIWQAIGPDQEVQKAVVKVKEKLGLQEAS